MCLIFAADHGVAKEVTAGGANYSAYPQSVTRKVLQSLQNKIAGASVLAKENGVTLKVVDMGLAREYTDIYQKEKRYNKFSFKL